MTITNSIIYFAVVGGLLYLACNKSYSTGAIPVSSPVDTSPPLSTLREKTIAEDGDIHKTSIDVRNIPAGYVPIDYSRLTE